MWALFLASIHQHKYTLAHHTCPLLPVVCSECLFDSLQPVKELPCSEPPLSPRPPAVCSECLFDSLQPVKELPCGHLMHSSCFATYIRYNYTCPLCTKSIGDMTVYFQV